METMDNDRWVAERLSKLEPAWTPQITRSRVALERELRPRSGKKAWLAAAALAGLATAVFLVPQGRAVAQELWFRLFLNRIDIVRVDLSDAPLHTDVSASGQYAVAGLDEAAVRAGFRPRLPAAESWPGKPAISVIGAMTIQQTIRTADLRSALARVGALDVAVPDEWDRLALRARLGPLVAAAYPEEIQILQSRPVQLFVPAGFPLSRFAETAFRSVGLPWWEARALARRYVAQPSLLLGIPADEAARIEEVSGRWGSGLLIEEFGDDAAAERVSLVFSTKDGIYAIMSPSREVCLKVADLLPAD